MDYDSVSVSMASTDSHGCGGAFMSLGPGVHEAPHIPSTLGRDGNEHRKYMSTQPQRIHRLICHYSTTQSHLTNTWRKVNSEHTVDKSGNM
jgi:hypothetical protein